MRTLLLAVALVAAAPMAPIDHSLATEADRFLQESPAPDRIPGMSRSLHSTLSATDSLHYRPITVHDVDLLPNGNILVTDGGQHPGGEDSGIFEMDRTGLIQWCYTTGLRWPHNADQQSDRSSIISDSGNDRVIIVDQWGAIVWTTEAITLSDGSELRYPNDANLLFPTGNRLITDRDNHRVIEIDAIGNILWQFGVTGVPGNDQTHLDGPHNADRLANGRTIIADSNNDRVIEVDPAGVVVWQHSGGLDWPRDADRLLSGNTLITDSRNHRVIEVDVGHQTVWQYDGRLSLPCDADRLSSGNTLIANGAEIVEVDPAGMPVWLYTGPENVEEIWVRNPTNGVDLYCHIHRPMDFDSTHSYPGVVLIPGGSGTGTAFDTGGKAQAYADAGLVVLHFDPDGRGRSTQNGQYLYEDYNGFIQQDGLLAVYEHLVDRPETEDANCGMFSQSYGITMASGTLARYRAQEPCKFLIDFEGPHNRTVTATVNGGHVPRDTTDVAFWSEREADRFMPDLLCNYLRIQTELDHNPLITDNRHAIALVNSATNVSYGGAGRCPWTRVNDAGLNQPNRVYSLADPPAWLPEEEETLAYRVERLLEMVAMAPTSAPPSPALPAAFSFETGRPNPFAERTRLWFTLPRAERVELAVYDLSGRRVRVLQSGVMEAGVHFSDWDGQDQEGQQLASGVYFARIRGAGGPVAMARLLRLR